MNFFEKIGRGIKKIKTKLIVYAILVLVIVVLLIAPMAVSVVDAETKSGVKFTQDLFGAELWEEFLTSMAKGLVSPLSELGKCFTPDYFGTFIGMLKVTCASKTLEKPSGRNLTNHSMRAIPVTISALRSGMFVKNSMTL